MLQRFIVLIVVCLLFIVPAAQAQGSYTLTIMHTNDAHAQHEPDGDGNGGAALEAAVVNQIRAEVANTLLLDGGDRFTGSIFHTFYRGLDSARIMNALGYNAMVTGSYEFTHGGTVLAAFVEALDFPVVVANVDFSGAPELAGLIPPYTVLEVGGEQIGIIGVTRADARVRPVPGVVFSDDYVGSVQAAIDALNAEGVNKIILLSHLGYFDDLQIATELSSVDVIIGSDTNTLLSNTLQDAEGPYPAVTESAEGTPVLVVQAGQRNRYLGRLDTEFDAEGVLAAWGGDTIALTVDITPDPQIQALVEELRAPLGDFLNQNIGSTEMLLDGTRESCRFVECNLGNLITDAMRVYTGAQIGLHNGGGIRASIEAGDITVADVLNVLPFSNTVVTFELSGIDIVAALENSVSRIDATEGTGRFLQVSGLRFSYDGSQPAGQRVTNVEVQNRSGDYDVLDPDDVYTIVTNDFLYAGGDDYSMFAQNSGAGFDFGVTLDEVVREYITANSPLRIGTEERITRLDR
ncbi:MAG: 5'-nucleotidase C-terminal domain-containing protein [Chloroflexi bacterium]|nr:5'-nucleotidase C-terminal domain-containing protein [Chloroflexota bacterium]